MAVGELLSTALPGAFLGRLLDLELLREVWRDALAPEFPDLADAAFPVAFDRGVVTLRARDRKSAAALARARKPLCRALLTACRLPGAPLRLRVVFPAKRSPAGPGGEAGAAARPTSRPISPPTSPPISPPTASLPAGNN